MSNVQKQMRMMNAVSEAVSFRKKNPRADHSDIMDYISNNVIKFENDPGTKIAMIAATSKVLEILDKNPGMSERQVTQEIVKELPGILRNLEVA